MNRILDSPMLIFALSLVVLLLSVRIGNFFRQKQGDVKENVGNDFDLVMGAILTLLALIIGFSFSLAVSRYDQRKNYEATEANTIGTEYDRLDFLPAVNAAKARGLLKNYLDQRILFYSTRVSFYSSRGSHQLQQINAATAQLQGDLWAAVQAPAAAQPTVMVSLAVSGMNEVLDSQGYTEAAWSYRIPSEAWILMVFIAICCNMMIGYGSRRARAKGFLFLVVPFVVSLSFFLIADIDSPRSGIIRVHPVNLTSLSRSLHEH